MLISVIVPTVDGREESLHRCLEAYDSRSAFALQVIEITNAPTCGAAWNLGAAHAHGDYIHFTADDLEPCEGWDLAAVGCVLDGGHPAPRVLLNDPREASPGFSAIPFFSRAQWEAIGPSLTCHYYTDNYLSWRAEQHGWPVVFTRDYCFTHHRENARRGAGMTESDRMVHDARIFHAALAAG